MKNVIWDFDGTLYDTNPVMLKALLNLFEDFEIDFNDEKLLNKVMHERSIDYILTYFSEQQSIPKNKLQDVFKYYEEQNIGKPRMMNGIDEVLKLVSENGGSNYLLTHRDSSAIKILEEDGLSDYFNDYVTKVNGFARKPSTEGIDYLIKKYNLDPSQTIIIGDRNIDVLTGKNSNIKTAYYTQNGFFSDESEADYSLNQISDIIPLIIF